MSTDSTPDTTAVLGYAIPLECHPGQTVQFKLSSKSLSVAHAQILKVRCGDPSQAGPGLRWTDMPSPVDGTVSLRHQRIAAGSSGRVDDAPALRGLRSFSVGCWIWPTRLAAGPQTVMARCSGAFGWRFGLDSAGRVVLDLGVLGALATKRAALEREWLFVGASYDADTGDTHVFQFSQDLQAGRDRSSGVRARLAGLPGAWPSELPLHFAADAQDGDLLRHFNGKIDRPRLFACAWNGETLRERCEAGEISGEADWVGAWDFSLQQHSADFTDLGPYGLHGTLSNNPTRAVTGANWTGQTHQWTQAPHEYGAIHFHDDDIDDCRWETDLTLEIPTDWPSGFYALKLTAPPSSAESAPIESHVPFFIGAAPGAPRAKLALVASTATFLAYSNNAIQLDHSPTEAMLEQLLVLDQDDVYLQEHRELGLSTYDTHSDGSGWCYASGRRPILNMRPRAGGYYSMDTRVIDWLEHLGEPYDVITDEAIHRHGAELLAGYTCVITGCHPEYFTGQMLDAFENFQGQGGRHVYLGGNGFYWRTAFHPTRDALIEIRRGLNGTRTWEGEAGENCLSFTGEPSGLWRSSGRAPQRLVGVGFDAQVFDRGGSYRRLPHSFDPRAAFVFEGIGTEEVIGNFGLRGGAAGHEIDRLDRRLGSPPNLLHLATADDMGSGGLATPEEFGVSHRGLGGDLNTQIRADMCFFPTGRGGAVFATGSIAWCMALSHQGYENNVARITANVVRRFVDPSPFAGFETECSAQR